MRSMNYNECIRTLALYQCIETGYIGYRIMAFGYE